ncbi:uncharacterized protein LOC119367634 [Triticum dicoccoides]|uniref:uncharacterized protein LOC119367634 n=1 Tax=Triticum dicoccoides TaxID=85692 RepID=UPI000E78E641|nr:uncharacterized protein LOC119367634 [Triticum dicoccoides]
MARLRPIRTACIPHRCQPSLTPALLRPQLSPPPLPHSSARDNDQAINPSESAVTSSPAHAASARGHREEPLLPPTCRCLLPARAAAAIHSALPREPCLTAAPQAAVSMDGACAVLQLWPARLRATRSLLLISMWSMHKLPHHGSLVVLSSASPLEIQGVPFCSSARGSTGFSLFEFSDLQCNPSYSLFCQINDSAWAAIVEKQKYVDEAHCVCVFSEEK